MTVGCKKVHVDLRFRFKFNCKHEGAESITVNMFIKFVRTNFEFKILASSKSIVSRERF